MWIYFLEMFDQAKILWNLETKMAARWPDLTPDPRYAQLIFMEDLNLRQQARNDLSNPEKQSPTKPYKVDTMEKM